MAASAAAVFAAPFTPGNIAVVRVGDGSALSGSLTTSISVLEISATGEIVQTIPIAATGTTPLSVYGTFVSVHLLQQLDIAGRIVRYRLSSRLSSARQAMLGLMNQTLVPLLPAAPHLYAQAMESHGSLSADGRFIVVGGYQQQLGAATTTSALTRGVARIGPDGVVDQSTVFTVTATENFRSAASLDGSRYYYGTSNGLKSSVHGVNTAAIGISGSTSSTLRGMLAAPSGLYLSVGSSPFGISRAAVGSAWPTTAGAVSVVGTLIPNVGTGIASIMGVAVQEATPGSLANATIWLACNSAGFALHKFIADSSGNFTAAPGFPKASVSFTDTVTAATVSVSGTRGIAVYRDPSSGAATVFATTITTGANHLIRYNEGADTWSMVARAGTGFDFRNPIGAVPFIAPSPTNTPTGTATPSATATMSGGASPTGTSTPTQTGTPTPTQTLLPCSTQTGGRMVAQSGSVFVLRLGSGTTPLATTGYREFFMDEVDVTTGARLQSIAVPSDPSQGGCVAGMGLTTEAYIARSANGDATIVGCWGMGLNSHVTGTAVSNSVAKVVGKIDATGAWSVAASFTCNATVLRSVNAFSTEPGALVYAFTSSGIRAAAVGGLVNQSAITIAPGSTRGSTAFGGSLYSVHISAGIQAISDVTSQLQPAAFLPGTTGTGNSASIVFKDAASLFVTDYAGAFTVNGYALNQETGVWGLTLQKYAMNLTFGGSSFTTGGCRGATGMSDPATGNFVILCTTNGQSGNYLVKYDTVTDTFTALARSCFQTEWRAVAGVATWPSSSPTPTNSPAADVTPTSSRTASPTSSVTPTGTGTPTATATPFCNPPATVAAPFTPGNFLTIRVGDGRAPLSSSSSIASPVFVEEFSPVSGSLVQTIRIPDGPVVWNSDGSLASAGCTLAAQFTTDGFASAQANGGAVYLACYAYPVGATIASSGIKVVMKISPNGAIAPEMVFTNGAAQLRSIATLDGSVFHFGTSFGIHALAKQPFNSTSVPASIAVTSTANTYRGVGFHQGGLYAAQAASGVQVVLIGGVTGFASAPVASPAPAPTVLPGLLVASGTASFVFENPTTLWVLESSNIVLTITKYVRATVSATAAWSLQPGFPRWGFNASDGTTIATGGRGSTGWTDPADGQFWIITATSAGAVKFNSVTYEAVVLSAPCENTQFRGIAMVPFVPSPSSTPTSTPTTSGSPSGTRTSTAASSTSATATISSGVSATSTGSVSATATVTASPTPSSSAFCRGPTGAAAPFSAGSILAIRVGDGRSALQTSTSIAREVFVEEWNPSTNVLVQTIRIPDGAPVYDANGMLVSAGCGLNAQYVTDGYATRSVDAVSVVLGCFALPVGSTITSATPKNIVLIRADGTITSAGVYTSGAAQLRSVATIDGSAFWIGGSFGADFVVPSRNVSAPAVAVPITTTANSYRGVGLFQGGLYGSNAGTTTSQVQLLGGLAFAASPPTSSPAPTPYALPGVSNGLSELPS